MATNLFDEFQNYSNDYINPALSPCAGVSDTTTFQFIPGQQVGIVSGNNVLAALSLNDILQSVLSWNQQTYYLQPGEVTYIQGLTKGLSIRTQRWILDGSVSYYNYQDPDYMGVDISINYYNGFKYYEKNIHAEADETLGINIESAINIEFSNNNINVTVSYDSSGFTFEGNTAGYSYNITAIDVSRWVPDTPEVRQSITEDVSSSIPAFKYPNSAMLGYVLKVTYPSEANTEDSYIKINHVPDYLTYYELSDSDSSLYIQQYKSVDVGMNGNSTSSTMSAGDYLAYIEENNKWEKVGLLQTILKILLLKI